MKLATSKSSVNRFYSSNTKMPSGIILCDKNGLILHASPQALRDFGAHLVGSDITALMNPLDAVLFRKYISSSPRTCSFYRLTSQRKSLSAVHSGFDIDGIHINAFITSNGDEIKLRRLVNSSTFDILDPLSIANLYDDMFFGAHNQGDIRASDIADFYEACTSLVSVLARPFSYPADRRFFKVAQLVDIWHSSLDVDLSISYSPISTSLCDICVDAAILITLASAVASLMKGKENFAVTVRCVSDKIAFEFSADSVSAPNMSPTSDVLYSAELLGFEWFTSYFIRSLIPIAQLKPVVSCHDGRINYTLLLDISAPEASGMKQYFADPALFLIADMCNSIF